MPNEILSAKLLLLFVIVVPKKNTGRMSDSEGFDDDLEEEFEGGSEEDEEAELEDDEEEEDYDELDEYDGDATRYQRLLENDIEEVNRSGNYAGVPSFTSAYCTHF
jgi:hypothetical protein